MSTDARFEDGAERPLRLAAADTEDLSVISALLQDAVMPSSEMRYDRRKRRFVALVNRFRWEDRTMAERQGRAYERVRAVLMVEDVTSAALQGITPGANDVVLSLLSLGFEPGNDGTGSLTLAFAGDGAIRLDVECVNVVLADATRPYAAPSRKPPAHPLDEA